MLTGHFIESSKGKVFVTQFGDITQSHAILCLPSITEEMNLSRAVIAGQAEYFRLAGFPTFVLDYSGTGDSEGELEDVTVTDWHDDIVHVGNWLQAQGITSISLWGVRFGSLLGLAFAKSLSEQLPILSQLHWQPIVNGALFAKQFLRLKQINQLMNKQSKINWREQLTLDGTLDIAGYRISNTLFKSIEQLKVSDDFLPEHFIDWRDLGSGSVSPYIARVTKHWDANSYQVSKVNTPAFWQIPEVYKLPDLYQSHASFLTRIR